MCSVLLRWTESCSTLSGTNHPWRRVFGWMLLKYIAFTFKSYAVQYHGLIAECEGNRCLRNVGNNSSNDTASLRRRPEFSNLALSLWSVSNTFWSSDNDLLICLCGVEVNWMEIIIQNSVEFLTRGGPVGWGTALQNGRSRVRFPMWSFEFFIHIILPAALWP